MMRHKTLISSLEIFVFKGYSRRTLKYPLKIELSHLTHIPSIANLVAINAEIPKINSG